MRLISVTLRNYRLHKELAVEFDASRNLIGGPNESGKSTLAEAVHRALFLRAKTGGKIQKEMVSRHLGGNPEVSLLFEAAGSRWELEKSFAGSKGSARLTRAGAAPLKDGEAEAKLAEILNSETAGGGAAAKLLPSLWSHLWVWQGSSGEDPAAHASAHKDTLVQRLQQDGVAAVMQSEADQRARETIAARYEELFTATGKARAGSKPELLRLQVEQAEDALCRAKDVATRLDAAVNDHATAERALAETEATLPGLRKQQAAAEATLAQVKELREQEDGQSRAAENASRHRERIDQDDASIRELQRQAEQAREALLPAEGKLSSLVTAEQAAREAARTGELAQRESADAVRRARLDQELATAHVVAIEKSAIHHQLGARQDEATALRGEITGVREALAKLPPLTAKQVDGLRKLDRTHGQATATLEAMATGIELLACDATVRIDGEDLGPGESRILTDSGELCVGTGTRLRIRPGGGSSLGDARAAAESARRAFCDALDRLAVSDLDEASAAFAQRQGLEQKLAGLETRWDALGGEKLAAEFAAATAELDAVRAELVRRTGLLGEASAPPPPASLELARAAATTTREELGRCESAEAAARQSHEQQRAGFEKAAEALQAHRGRFNDARQNLRDLETRIKVLEETHGDAAARDNALAQAREAEQAANGRLTATRKALAELAPDDLTADLDRYRRAISQQEDRRREAEQQRLIARDRLTLDGSSDPQAELSHALARHAAAVELHASEQRRAMAIESLHRLFSDSREAIDRSLVQPLADRISGYLQCIFGAGAGVNVHLSESGIEGLELVRAGDSPFHFATLSGGAREQVAAAVRLAMAEILAADHDGCLPVVFDDAFAYTDPERVQSLQRMLDRAAQRGLQVIVLTCTPVDYSALGAAEIRL